VSSSPKTTLRSSSIASSLVPAHVRSAKRADRRQHLVEVQARADRLTDLTKRLQLVDRLRQLGAALLQLAEQLRVADRDHTLRREGRHELYRPLAEWIDLRAPQQDYTDDAAVHEHRHPEHGPEAAQLTGLLPLVAGVGGGVGYLEGAALQLDAAHQRSGPVRDRAFLEIAPVRGGATDHAGKPVLVAFELVDHARVRGAQSHSVAQDRLEHRL
jgi:hypothetical protein